MRRAWMVGLVAPGLLLGFPASALAQDAWADYGEAMLSWELTRGERASERAEQARAREIKFVPKPESTTVEGGPTEPALKEKRTKKRTHSPKKTKKRQPKKKRLGADVEDVLEGIE